MKNGNVWAVVCMMVSMGLFACGGGGSLSKNTNTLDTIRITNISPASAVANQSTSFI